MTEGTVTQVEIESFDPARRGEWESFVAQSANGTLFHRLAFLDYHPAGRIRFHHLMARKEGRLVAVIPGALAEVAAEHGGGVLFQSPAGASFGGPVFERGFDPALPREVLGALTEEACRDGWRTMLLGPPPEVYWREGWEHMAGALEAVGFRPASTEVTQIVPLDPDEEELWHTLDRQARKAVRKSYRDGLAVGPSRDWEAFHPVLVADRARNGVVPTHSLQELKDLDAGVGEALELLLARKEGRVGGGVLVFRASSEVALNFYLCRDDDVPADRPTDVLSWDSLLRAKAAGCRWYDFGTSSVNGVVNQGLWRFKRKFGAVDFPRTRWRWEAA